jgi:hypothetical protein
MDFKHKRDEYLALLRKHVATHPAGIAVQSVSDDPPWAYSIGLLPRHGFEVIVFMLRPEIAATILNDIAKSLDQGVKITPDVPMPDNPWIVKWPALFKLCDPLLLGDRVNIAKAYHQRDEFPVYQLVLCDKQGRFPGEPDYALARQPLMYHLHPEASTAAAQVLPMWTIYDHPRDMPEHWVARRWEVSGTGGVATPEVLTADTLEALRAQLPPDLCRMPRQPGDDPTIVEVWL